MTENPAKEGAPSPRGRGGGDAIADIARLFLSELRDGRDPAHPRPQRTPPPRRQPPPDPPDAPPDLDDGGPVPAPPDDAAETGGSRLSEATQLPARGGCHVLWARTGGQMRLLSAVARALAASAGPIAVLALYEDQAELSLCDPDLPGDSREAESTDSLREMTDAIRELACDVGGFVVAVPGWPGAAGWPNAAAPTEPAGLIHVIVVEPGEAEMVETYRAIKRLVRSPVGGESPRVLLACPEIASRGSAERLCGVTRRYLGLGGVEILDLFGGDEASPPHPVLEYRGKPPLTPRAALSLLREVLGDAAEPMATSPTEPGAALPTVRAAPLPAEPTATLPAEPVGTSPAEPMAAHSAVPPEAMQATEAPRSEQSSEPQQSSGPEEPSEAEDPSEPRQSSMPSESSEPPVSAGAHGPSLLAEVEEAVFERLGDGPGGLLDSLLRAGSFRCLGMEPPCQPTGSLAARVAVDADGRLTLLAAPVEASLAELARIAAALAWVRDSARLLARAAAPLRVNPELGPVLRLYLGGRGGVELARGLGGLFGPETVRVEAVRSLRWGDRRGYLLEAA